MIVLGYARTDSYVWVFDRKYSSVIIYLVDSLDLKSHCVLNRNCSISYTHVVPLK